MDKRINTSGICLVLGLILIGILVFSASANAATSHLTPVQMNAVVTLLEAFGVDNLTIDKVREVLGAPKIEVPFDTCGFVETRDGPVKICA